MKKKKLRVILVVALLLAAAAVVYLYLSDPAGAEAIAKEKIIPIGVVALSTVLTIYTTVSPVIEKARRVADQTESSCNSFRSATADLQGENAENLKRYRALAENYAELTARLSEAETERAQNRQMLTQMREMLRIGFTNNPDLVSGGYARKIAEIAGSIQAKPEDKDDREEDADGESGRDKT